MNRLSPICKRVVRADMDKKMLIKMTSGALATATKYITFIDLISSDESKTKNANFIRYGEVVIGLDEWPIDKAEVRLIIANKTCEEMAKVVIDCCYNLTIRRLHSEKCVDFEFEKKVELNTEVRCVIEILSLLVSYLWEDFDYIDFNENTNIVFIWWADDSVSEIDVTGLNSLDALYKVFSFCYIEQTKYKYLK